MNDTDRKITEYAAKAFGLQVKGWIGDRLHYFNPITNYEGTDWNPLYNDGDAFRLLAHISIRSRFGFSMICPDKDDTTTVVRDYELVNATTEVITTVEESMRRAITIAAAMSMGYQQDE